MCNILINASNLHSGGGVQVAASFITNLFHLKLYNYKILCSSEVLKNINIDTSCFSDFHVYDSFGLVISKQAIKISKSLSNVDICFTIFGPCYLWFKPKYHICGFAQPWIAYSRNDVYSKLSIKNKIILKMKYMLQKELFLRYDALVVEQSCIKENLVLNGFEEKKIKVVNNCISSVFNDKSEWQSINNIHRFEKNGEIFILGYIGRSYIHKNLSILKEVNDLLLKRYGRKFLFVFTLTDKEMSELGFDKVDNFFSVGKINIFQCPSFYDLIDALIFPSLLECFSASPLESMYMGKPVIASDRDFIKDVCKNSAFYFDPLNAFDIVDKIVECMINSDLTECYVNSGKVLANNNISSFERTDEYLNLINNFKSKIV